MDKSGFFAQVGKYRLDKAPLVELVGQCRVLIENHLGVLAYSLEEVQVKVCYGKIVVTGNNLMLLQMNCEQLVIKGEIHGVSLHGR